MSLKKPFVIYLAKQHIWLGQVMLSADKKTSISVFQFPWDKKNLAALLSQNGAATVGSSIRILAADEISYVLMLDIRAIDATGEYIAKTVRSYIPDEVRSNNISWLNAGKSATESNAYIQVLVVGSEYLEILSLLKNTHNIPIETVSSVSLLLAEMTAGFDKPHIIIWRGQEFLGVIAYKGHAYGTKHLVGDLRNAIKQLSDLARLRYKLVVEDVIVEESIEDDVGNELRVTRRALNPLAFLLQEKTPIDKSTHRVEIQISHGFPSSSSPQTEAHHPSRALLVAFVSLVLLLGVLVYFFLFL